MTLPPEPMNRSDAYSATWEVLWKYAGTGRTSLDGNLELHWKRLHLMGTVRDAELYRNCLLCHLPGCWNHLVPPTSADC